LNGTIQQIEGAFATAGIVALPATAFDQFETYLNLLQRWNQRLNLTSVREPVEIIQRHFVECAFAAQHLPLGVGSLLDYGSGAGFPGIPLAICRPEIRATLAEAHGRKASFLREALRELRISGEVYDGRVEMMPAERLFDAVALRAVEKMERAIPAGAQRATRFLVLFTTAELAGKHRGLASGFAWPRDIELPNADRRVLAIGHRG
jgi:16S rRNA (guanine527-N7)-methyltransferase